MESVHELREVEVLSQTAPSQMPSTSRQRADLSSWSFLPRELQLFVDAGPGCGGVTWPAALVLSRYMAHAISQDPGRWAGRTALELGSGTGCVALALALLQPAASRIIATDVADMLPLMHENVELNSLGGSVHVEELNWGGDLPDTTPAPVDLLLLADCVYFEPAFPLLVQTMDALIGEKSDCLFCYKKRRKADKHFFTQAKKIFEFVPVNDDPSGSLWSREGIHLFWVSRRGQRKAPRESGSAPGASVNGTRTRS